MLRMDCFKKLGLFDETIPWGLDYDMWIRIAEKFNFEPIQEPLVKYYYHKDQISNFPELRIKGIETLLRKHGTFFREDSKAFSQHLLDIGGLYSIMEDHEKAIVMFSRAIGIYPYGLAGYRDMAKGLSMLILGERNYTRIKWVKNILASILDGNRQKNRREK